MQRTLDVGDALLEDLLESLGALELLLHLGDDALRELLLLALLHLALVADPRVKDGLGLGGEGGLLLELEGLGLDLSSLLEGIVSTNVSAWRFSSIDGVENVPWRPRRGPW